MLEKTKKISTSNQVVNILKEAIENGTFKVGDKLPNEADLSEQLGVGRSSIREGMRILSGYGLVDIRQGEGTFVADNSAEQIMGFMGYEGDSRDFQYLSQMRHICESGCINLIMKKHLNTSLLKTLEKLVEDLEKAETTEDAVTADERFHKLLFDYTENPILIRLYAMVSKLINNLMTGLMQYEDVRRDARIAHRQILEAIESGDRDQAIYKMEEHLNTVDYYSKKYMGLS